MKNLFVNSDKGIKINKQSVHKLVTNVKSELSKKVDNLEINFVNAETILRINNQHLGHNYETDVISFDYSTESNSFDGEIFICSEIAFENSKRFAVLFDDELKRLVIHGILHFSGYDDKTPSLRKKMKIIEDELLNQNKKIKLLKK